MADNALIDLTVTQALEGLARKSFSDLEYVDALIAQSEKSRDLNAFVSYDWDALRAAARRYDQGDGVYGRLGGIPLALKDNINTTTLTSAAGTTVLRGFTPATNAPVVNALMAEGALLGGKTNMHELAFGVTTNNGATGASRNPYNRDYIPGGSSGGTGVAVAQRIMPAGLGSDTGASVRLPAALCGIFGFRPSMGRYSTKGVVPCSAIRDTIGPMTRTVEDAVLLDAVITGEPGPFLPIDLKGVRLGVPRKYFYENLDSEVARIAEGFLDRLAAAGAVLVETEVENVGALNAAFSFTICLYEFAHNMQDFLREQGYRLTLQDLCDGIGSPDVKGVVASQLGSDAISDAAYREAITVQRPLLLRAYADCFARSRVEALVFPVSPVPARPIGEDETIELNGKRVSTIFTYIQNTDPSSNTGLTAASIPAGLTAQGLPVGMEVDGPSGTDRRILGIARSIERLIGTLPKPGATPRRI